ncbi:CRISPR-associated protein, Cmr1 family (plasmid) [Cylindrospermum stagnale PCC 7417]|uniref:CRISPR-associated protein, Cmr1 family n=1 Tax=Cylindrospermum stagnale PCC 7417 TaxID=56107 RepID=K9X7J2_9NOST|nr:type III-B CRISPR module RAMP protein Cmr1 [Cylindrospermum stagnale]AFZ28590.1 CRISPR-associated protein, Cmr1 family [Cylindrospermum stagnale PCC 7417]
MEVKIQTLTPIWTGGIEAGKCDLIHETGLLGSLRWWMEVLVRGLGGVVCDPTAEKSQDRSSLDTQKFNAKKYRELQDEVERRKYLRDAGLCDVSQIFGATGWKRRFRLEVQEVQVSDATIQHPITASRSYLGMKRPPTWYFPDPTKKDVKPQPPNTPITGSFIIKIQSLNPDFKPEIIGGLIQFIADWSALGARPQMGFGVIEIEGDRINTQPLYNWLIATNGSQLYPDIPALQNIFLAQIQPKDLTSSFKEQDTFNLKYDLRKLFRTENDPIQRKSAHKSLVLKKDSDKDLRHFIMGTVEDERMAAKIKISRPYDNEKLIRVWGWIPEEAAVYKNGWDREKIVNDIYKHLEAKYTLHIWREMNSTRDTKTPLISEAKLFLHSLLQLQEGNYAV